MHMMCAIVCCPLGGLLANIFGRRSCMIAFALLFLAGWSFIALSWNVTVLFIERFITVISAAFVAVPIGTQEEKLQLSFQMAIYAQIRCYALSFKTNYFDTRHGFGHQHNYFDNAIHK